MGTNYYFIKNVYDFIDSRSRYDNDKIFHIGKDAFGWTFGFHGTDEIKSYDDIIKKISDKKGAIIDEYGDFISLMDFKKLVKHKMASKNNHALKYGDDSGRDWVDKYGHSFSSGEFC